jgi:PncC family amidohydrolase
VSRVFSTFGLAESKLDELLVGVVDPAEARLAFRAAFPRVQARITVSGAPGDDLEGRLDALEARVRERLGTHLYAIGDEGMEETVGRLLKERGMTLAVASRAPGGLIGHRITDVPGSSAYFLMGVATYSNDAKERVLGVRAETLREHGAVSTQTAEEMAEGVRRLAGADLGVSTTGIAGPGGGTRRQAGGHRLHRRGVGGRRMVAPLRCGRPRARVGQGDDGPDRPRPRPPPPAGRDAGSDERRSRRGEASVMTALFAVQPTPDPTAGAVTVALIASIFIAIIFSLHRWAGVGCAGSLVFLFLGITTSAGGTAGGIIGSLIIVFPLVAIVGIERWVAARKRRALEASARAHEAASRRQRSAIPSDARLLGRAVYQGGIPTMTPGLEWTSSLQEARSGLRPPVRPSRRHGWTRHGWRSCTWWMAPIVWSWCSPLARAATRRWSSPRRRAASPAARQLYAVLDAALPAQTSSGATPAPRVRAPCGGCGAMDAGDGPGCRYCGRPVS